MKVGTKVLTMGKQNKNHLRDCRGKTNSSSNYLNETRLRKEREKLKMTPMFLV